MTTSSDLSAAGPHAVRNVALVGPSGSGKTSLVEALLLASGTIHRAGRVEDGTTVSDHEAAEHRQHRSVGLALAPLHHGGLKVNLLDTPGYPDFVGELRAGLRAADAALFVISAADGVDAATVNLWEECAALGLPRAVVVTRLDDGRADFDDMVAICQRVLGGGVLPMYLPLHGEDDAPAGVLGLLGERVYDYSGGTRVERDPDPEHLPLIEGARADLIEAIIAESEDETLMDRYLEGAALDVATLVADLEKAVARGSFHPVLLAVPPTGLGTAEVLELVTQAFPAPAEHDPPVVTTPDGAPRGPFHADPAGPLVAEVVRTTSDPYLGRLSLVRVFSGTLRPDAAVHVSGHTSDPSRAAGGHPDHDVDERVGALSSPLGRALRPVSRCCAGDIAMVARLSRAETGDTLSDPDDPLLIQPWLMPEPLLPVAVVARAVADEAALGQGLARLVAEDPTLRLEVNPATHQVVLWCLGEAHADVLLDRLSTRYGVAVDAVPLRVPLRETFAEPARGHGRHIEQSGGHRQFAVCDIEVTPLAPGGGFEFVDGVVGGPVPRQFVASVEKGLRAQLERGVRGGFPMIDVRVTLVDGRAHSEDSSDMAFQTAAALALRDAAAMARVDLLEPVDAVTVVVLDEYVGAVLSDLAARRGRVTGTEPVGAGRTSVSAEVPQRELARYAIDLRSVSHGTGAFTRTYARHAALPAHLAAAALAAGPDH